MSEMIEGFQSLDSDLIQAFPIKVSPVLMLEDIQVGSLRTVIKNVLTGIDDEAIAGRDPAIHLLVWRI